MHGTDCKCVCCERMKKIPGILWVALAALALMGLARAFAYLHAAAASGHDNTALSEALLCGALLVSLFLGWRGAYVLTFVFVVVEVVRGFHWEWEGALRAFLNCLWVLIPVLVSRDYFPSADDWPDYTAQRWSSEPETPEPPQS